MRRLLFIDNYDSFTYNVVHLLASQGADLDVLLNDAAALSAGALANYGALVIGPGPGSPAQQPQMLEVLRAAIQREMPVFGVCLGLQAVVEATGGSITHAPAQLHGKTSLIAHDGTGLFEGLPSPFRATRYHSLAVSEPALPRQLRVTARSEDGVVQGIADVTRPVHAVQFHPESVLSEHGAALAANFLKTLR